MDKLELDNQAEAAAELVTALQELVIEGSEKTRDHTTYITIRKFGTECTINAEWTVNWGAQKVITKDSAGNDYIQATLNVTVSYQNHGSNDLELVTNRVRFILACCEAANQLKAARQDKKVYQVWDTVEDREKRTQENNASVVKDAIIPNTKGLRVNHQVSFWRRGLLR